MPEEIERKFLLKDDSWRSQVERSFDMAQGYLGNSQQCSIRVRVSDETANLNIKSATLGVYRQEYDYVIPVDEAREILDTLADKPLIEKTRHIVRYGEHTWEIDEFFGDNAGLIVAEIELGSADEAFEKPAWLGADVSDDPRYYNVCLVSEPYACWPENRRPGPD